MIKVYPKTEEVLRLLAGGTVLTALILSPHLTLAAISTLSFLTGWGKYRPFQLKRTIDRLRKRNLVKIVEKNNETIVELTELGQSEILRYDINKMKIPIPKKWNTKWWLVIFDIPNDKRKTRDVFAGKLKDMGFYFLQESVCVHAHPCQKEIEFIREVYGIKKYVEILEVTSFEGEYKLKEQFDL